MSPVRSSEILNARALNRALLARQLLLERRALPVAHAVEHLVGMQTQEPQAPYLGLWARLEAFAPDELSDLIAARRVVRGGLMRATLHLVTDRDWVRLRPLMGPVLARNFNGSPFSKAIAGVDVDELLAHGRALLAERPRTRAELGRELAAQRPGVDRTALAYAVSYLEPIVQVPPRGLWRHSGQARWTTDEAWIGTKSAAHFQLHELIERYLGAFGPATVQDIAAWSGLTGLSQAVRRAREGLRSFRDEQGRELLDVSDGPLPDPDTPAPPRFLPPFDNVILSHADRARIVGPSHRGVLSTDRLMRTFLVDGFVAGIWHLERATLHVRPSRRLRQADLQAVGAEAERLVAFAAPDQPKHRVRVHEPT